MEIKKRNKRPQKNYGEYKQFLLSIAEDNSDSRNRLKRNLRIALLEELTETQFETVMLYVVHGLKLREIVEQKCVNVSTVCRNLHRGLEKLKKALRYGAADLLADDIENRRDM